MITKWISKFVNIIALVIIKQTGIFLETHAMHSGTTNVVHCDRGLMLHDICISH